MRLLYLGLFVTFIFGCSSRGVTIEDLQIKNNKYYLNNSKTPYSGKVVSKFEDGGISDIVEMKDGIPNGKWVAYGYNKEVIQEGTYCPFDVEREAEFATSNISRFNVCITKEGSIEFTNVFLITDDTNKVERESLKPQVFLFLKNYIVLFKGDTINEIRYLKGELEK